MRQQMLCAGRWGKTFLQYEYILHISKGKQEWRGGGREREEQLHEGLKARFLLIRDLVVHIRFLELKADNTC